jgi:hypothetical protein
MGYTTVCLGGLMLNLVGLKPPKPMPGYVIYVTAADKLVSKFAAAADRRLDLGTHFHVCSAKWFQATFSF